MSGADWKLPVEKVFPTWDVLQTRLTLLRARGAQRDLHSPGTSSPGGTVRVVTPLSEAPPPTPLHWRALGTPALGRLGSPEGPETGPPGWVLGQACRGQHVWGPHIERSSSYSTIPPPDLPILPPCVVSRPLKLGVQLGLGRRWKARCWGRSFWTLPFPTPRPLPVWQGSLLCPTGPRGPLVFTGCGWVDLLCSWGSEERRDVWSAPTLLRKRKCFRWKSGYPRLLWELSPAGPAPLVHPQPWEPTLPRIETDPPFKRVTGTPTTSGLDWTDANDRMMWKAFIFAEVDHRPPGAGLASWEGNRRPQDWALWWGHVPGQPLTACVCGGGWARVCWVGTVLVNGAPSLLSLSFGAPHRARAGWGPDWEGALRSRHRGWASLGPPVTQVLYTAGHVPHFSLALDASSNLLMSSVGVWQEEAQSLIYNSIMSVGIKWGILGGVPSDPPGVDCPNSLPWCAGPPVSLMKFPSCPTRHHCPPTQVAAGS